MKLAGSGSNLGQISVQGTVFGSTTQVKTRRDGTKHTSTVTATVLVGTETKNPLHLVDRAPQTTQGTNISALAWGYLTDGECGRKCQNFWPLPHLKGAVIICSFMPA